MSKPEDLNEKVSDAEKALEAAYGSEDSADMIAAAIDLAGLRIERALVRIARAL